MAAKNAVAVQRGTTFTLRETEMTLLRRVFELSRWALTHDSRSSSRARAAMTAVDILEEKMLSANKSPEQRFDELVQTVCCE